MKIVINACFGGFGLSKIAVKEYLSLKGKEAFFYVDMERSLSIHHPSSYKKIEIPTTEELFPFIYCSTVYKGEQFTRNSDDKFSFFYDDDIERTDPDLVKVVEMLGDKASSWGAKLKVVDIPDDVKYQIDDYDGVESVHECHRVWE